MATQLEKAQAFQALHNSEGCFVIPNPWDIGSTRILEQSGFKALATTSAGVAFSLGRPDGENAATREDILENARVITSATDLPVSADLENGYSNEPDKIAETITLAAKAGLVGGSIEDRTMNPAGPIRDIAHAVECVTAAVETRAAQPFPFTLTARAENFLCGVNDLNDTIKRLQAFQEAGADVLYAPGLTTKEQIAAVTSSIDRPLNVVMGLNNTPLSIPELAELGVKRISLGSTLARAAFGALFVAIEEIQNQGTFNFASNATPFAELNQLFQGKAPD